MTLVSYIIVANKYTPTTVLSCREVKALERKCAMHFCCIILKLISVSATVNRHLMLSANSLSNIFSKNSIILCSVHSTHVGPYYVRAPHREDFYQSLLSYNSQTAQSILDQVEWTDDASSMLETLLNTQFEATCTHRSVSF